MVLKFHQTIRNYAFTLAEVLIVLGIIGIIAEMTIPELVMNYRKQVYATRAEKAYSMFEQGMKQYLADQGTEMLGDTGLYDGVTNFSDPTRRQNADTVFRKYFHIVKSCVSGDTSCDTPLVTYLTKSGGWPSAINSIYYIFYTTDGIKYFVGLTPSCKPDNTKTGKLKGSCGAVLFDVNGDASPNQSGRDFIYPYFIGTDGNLYADYGKDWADFTGKATDYWSNVTTLCGTADSTILPANTTGYCAARIMEDGWRERY